MYLVLWARKEQGCYHIETSPSSIKAVCGRRLAPFNFVVSKYGSFDTPKRKVSADSLPKNARLCQRCKNIQEARGY